MKKNLSLLNNIKIAHRGLCKEGLVENSMSAFIECVKSNIPIELDLHILKDNTLVVIHDDDTERVTGKKIILKDAKYDDVKDLKLIGTNESIPLLCEVLERVNGDVLLDIELKYDSKDFRICYELCKILDNYKGDFILKSFNSIYVWWFRIYKSNYIRGLLMFNNKKNFFLKIFGMFANPDFVCLNYRRLPNKSISRLYNKGIPVLVYTVRDNVKVECEYTGIIFEK